jgi:hypothetical protein
MRGCVFLLRFGDGWNGVFGRVLRRGERGRMVRWEEEIGDYLYPRREDLRSELTGLSASRTVVSCAAGPGQCRRNALHVGNKRCRAVFSFYGTKAIVCECISSFKFRHAQVSKCAGENVTYCRADNTSKFIEQRRRCIQYTQNRKVPTKIPLPSNLSA